MLRLIRRLQATRGSSKILEKFFQRLSSQSCLLAPAMHNDHSTKCLLQTGQTALQGGRTSAVFSAEKYNGHF